MAQCRCGRRTYGQNPRQPAYRALSPAVSYHPIFPAPPRGVPYHYQIYEKGEFLQTPDSSGHNLYILLSGPVQIYSISSSGQKFPIATVGSDGTVGEVELCGQYVPFYAEVARKSECLVLSIADCRRYLSDDPVFLRFLLHILAEKLTFGSNIDYSVEI